MSNVIVKENESLDSALRRFKRNCAKAGIQQEIRKREHYVRRSQKLLENVSSINFYSEIIIPVYHKMHRDFFRCIYYMEVAYIIYILIVIHFVCNIISCYVLTGRNGRSV